MRNRTIDEPDDAKKVETLKEEARLLHEENVKLSSQLKTLELERSNKEATQQHIIKELTEKAAALDKKCTKHKSTIKEKQTEAKGLEKEVRLAYTLCCSALEIPHSHSLTDLFGLSVIGPLAKRSAC